MSLNFKKDDTMLWNLGMRAGRAFLAYVRALEPLMGMGSGISDLIPGDTYEVTGDELRRFTSELLDWYIATNSPVLRVMIEGVLRTCIVLSERADFPVEISRENVSERSRDERAAFAQKISSERWPMLI
jgi:hypothetical protein